VPASWAGYWFEPVTGPGQLGPAQLAQPPKRKKSKESGLDLSFRPSQPKLYLSRVCLAKRILMP